MSENNYLGFPFYPNYWETYELLAASDIVRARLFLEAIVLYGTEKVRPESGDAWIEALMPTIEKSLDANRLKNAPKYLKTLEQNENVVEDAFSELPRMDVQMANLDEFFGNSD